MASFLRCSQGDVQLWIVADKVVKIQDGPNGVGACVFTSDGEVTHVDEDPSRLLAACIADEMLSTAGSQ